MLVYRIVQKKYSQTLVAPGIEGRWNRRGQQVIYTAESIPLAFMGNMIRRAGLGFNDNFGIMIIEIPEKVFIEQLKVEDLKKGWRDSTLICQEAMADWYTSHKSAVMKVPSAVLSTNSNYVLNTTHADYSKIKLISSLDLVPDERIDEIIRRYNR
ncbi:MAG: RES domain-containing protein [Chitinophagaceae bacterium]|nr:MAG: RES domain-containing protein [Chitinophagaceae bacterium]